MQTDDFGARPTREGIDEDFLRRIIEDGEGDGERTSCRMSERARMCRRERRYPEVSEGAVPTSTCGCGRGDDREDDTDGWGLSGYPLAMVYVPVQRFCDLYDIEDGWRRGTIFAKLDLPLGEIPRGRGGHCCG